MEDNVIRLIPKETVILEPKITVEFDIEIIDYTGQVEGLNNGTLRERIFPSSD